METAKRVKGPLLLPSTGQEKRDIKEGRWNFGEFCARLLCMYETTTLQHQKKKKNLSLLCTLSKGEGSFVPNCFEFRGQLCLSVDFRFAREICFRSDVCESVLMVKSQRNISISAVVGLAVDILSGATRSRVILLSVYTGDSAFSPSLAIALGLCSASSRNGSHSVVYDGVMIRCGISISLFSPTFCIFTW